MATPPSKTNRDYPAGRPSATSPPGGSTGGGLPPLPPEPPAPPKKTAQIKDSKSAIAAIKKLPIAKKYRNFALITNIANARGVDPVALLIAAIGVDAAPTKEGFVSVANRLREGIGKYGSIDGWLRSVNGLPVEAKIKQNAKINAYEYTFPQTVPQKVTTAAELAAAKAAKSDPWVVLKDGKVSYVNSVNAPKTAVTFQGSPVRASDWQKNMNYYNDYFTKYIGRKAKPGEIVSIINKGMTPTAVQLMLTKDPAFKRGSIWQAQAPAILGYAKSMMGENWKSDPDFIRKAIVNNWSEGTLRAKLRARPEYLDGPEFKQNVAGLQNVYSQIQGRPDEAAVQGIKEAALGGWSSDQYAAYLRAQPQYTQSQEYKGKALSFLDALGLITGQQTTTQGIEGLGQPAPIPGSDMTTPHSDRLSPTSPGAAAGQVATKPVLTKNKAGTQAVRPVKNANQPGKPGFRPF